jgi:hypothetical protein
VLAAHDFARLVTLDEEGLATHAERDADPFLGGGTVALARRNVARARFQCQQQLERPVAQGPQGRLRLHPFSL